MKVLLRASRASGAAAWTPAERVLYVVARHLPRLALGAAVVTLIAGLRALTLATVALAAVSFAMQRFSMLWDLRGSVNDGDPDGLATLAARGRAVRIEVAALITLQGVVLTLIFTLVGSQPATSTVKVAAVALVVGICLGLVLSSVLTGDVTTLAQRRLTYNAFCLVAWSCAYGLLCLASAVILER